MRKEAIVITRLIQAQGKDEIGLNLLEVTEKVNKILGAGKLSFFLEEGQTRIIIRNISPEIWEEFKNQVLAILPIGIEEVKGLEVPVLRAKILQD